MKNIKRKHTISLNKQFNLLSIHRSGFHYKPRELISNDLELMKRINYLASGNPILAITSSKSAVENAIKEFNCGENSYINNSMSIFFSLRKLLMNNTYHYNDIDALAWESQSELFLKKNCPKPSNHFIGE